jgi:hypothetical protein
LLLLFTAATTVQQLGSRCAHFAAINLAILFVSVAMAAAAEHRRKADSVGLNCNFI